MKLLRMLETWLLVVVPDEFVALPDERTSGRLEATADCHAGEVCAVWATRGSLCVSVPLRCCLQVNPHRREWPSGEGWLLGRGAEGVEVARVIHVWQVQSLCQLSQCVMTE